MAERTTSKRLQGQNRPGGGRNREQASLPDHGEDVEEGGRSRQAGQSLRAPRHRETASDPKRHGALAA